MDLQAHFCLAYLMRRRKKTQDTNELRRWTYAEDRLHFRAELFRNSELPLKVAEMASVIVTIHAVEGIMNRGESQLGQKLSQLQSAVPELKKGVCEHYLMSTHLCICRKVGPTAKQHGLRLSQGARLGVRNA